MYFLSIIKIKGEDLNKEGMKMKRFSDWIQNKLMPPLVKVANQRHLKAVRNGLVITLPIIIAGSIFMIIGNIPIDAWTDFLEPYTSMIDGATNVTFGIIALLAAAGIAYELCSQYKISAISGVALSIMAFMITQLSDEFALNTDGFSSGGLFTAIISAIISVEIYHLCIKRNWIVRLPKGVPPAVGNSFVALISSAIVLVLFWIVRVPLHFNINEFFQTIFSPLVFALNTLPGIMCYTLLISLLWCAGVHGEMTLEGVASPIFLSLITANALAYQNGQPIPNVVAEGFSSLFVNIGGTGATFALVLLMLKSKSKTYKQLSKISLPAAVFEINEPVIFGFPIIMNPLMMIPFILVPLVLCVSTYLLMYFNIIGAVVIQVPWTMPPIIGPLMATGWDFRAAIWSAVEIVIAMLIYYPFFKIAEQQMLKDE